jgi:hypothetical protein
LILSSASRYKLNAIISSLGTFSILCLDQDI